MHFPLSRLVSSHLSSSLPVPTSANCGLITTLRVSYLTVLSSGCSAIELRYDYLTLWLSLLTDAGRCWENQFTPRQFGCWRHRVDKFSGASMLLQLATQMAVTACLCLGSATGECCVQSWFVTKGFAKMTIGRIIGELFLNE